MKRTGRNWASGSSAAICDSLSSPRYPRLPSNFPRSRENSVQYSRGTRGETSRVRELWTLVFLFFSFFLLSEIRESDRLSSVLDRPRRREEKRKRKKKIKLVVHGGWMWRRYRYEHVREKSSVRKNGMTDVYYANCDFNFCQFLPVEQLRSNLALLSVSTASSWDFYVFPTLAASLSLLLSLPPLFFESYKICLIKPLRSFLISHSAFPFHVI